MKHPKSKLPEFDRLIKLNCHDWSAYTIIGKLVKYKNGGFRFVANGHNAMDDWKNAESWEYVNREVIKLSEAIPPESGF